MIGVDLLCIKYPNYFKMKVELLPRDRTQGKRVGKMIVGGMSTRIGRFSYKPARWQDFRGEEEGEVMKELYLLNLTEAEGLKYLQNRYVGKNHDESIWDVFKDGG
jgi:hypothetical protein